ncbi:MAG: flagellar biosynthetic protein FliO [Planctomycetota bacterium]|nr:flagellar biosynthetic protein FliO [Planctomycetota bacterium]
MARPALQIHRFVLALTVTACFMVPFAAHATVPVPQAMEPLATFQIPDRERLPLGVSPAMTTEGETPASTGYLPEVMEFVRVGGALLAVVGLLLGLRLLLRRLGGMPSARRPAGIVQVHGRYPVARGQQVVLLQVGQRIIVAHQGSGGMRTLAEITDPDEVANIRGSLDGKRSGDSDTDFHQALAEAAAASEDHVVDLTRPDRNRVRTRETARRRSRLPGWRGAS